MGLTVAATAIFIIPSGVASYAQKMAYELHSPGGLGLASNDNSLCEITIARDLYFAVLTVENEHPRPIQNVLFVTQDINSNGMIESIEINANLTLPAAESMVIANKWEPLSAGNHTIEAFVWQMDSSDGASTALIEKQSFVVEVSKTC
jgi:hypothetical protein